MKHRILATVFTCYLVIETALIGMALDNTHHPHAGEDFTQGLEIHESNLDPEHFCSLGVKQTVTCGMILPNENYTLPKQYYLTAGKRYIVELHYQVLHPAVDYDIFLVRSEDEKTLMNGTGSRGMDEFLQFIVNNTGAYKIIVFHDAGDSIENASGDPATVFLHEYWLFSGKKIHSSFHMEGKDGNNNDQVEMYHSIKVSALATRYPLQVVVTCDVPAALDVYEVRLYPILGMRNLDIQDHDNLYAGYSMYRISHDLIDPLDRDQHEFVFMLPDTTRSIPLDWDDGDRAGASPRPLSIDINGSVVIKNTSCNPTQKNTVFLGREIIIVIIAEWGSGTMTVNVDLPGETTEEPGSSEAGNEHSEKRWIDMIFSEQNLPVILAISGFCVFGIVTHFYKKIKDKS